jgi:uncharacterized repeat protein (TIGR01451 family)
LSAKERDISQGAEDALPGIPVSRTPAKATFPKARNEPLQPAFGPSSLIVMDLIAETGPQQLSFSLYPEQRIKFRLPNKFENNRIEIDKPEVMRLISQNPNEFDVVAVHPGTACIKLWDAKNKLYTIHAKVIHAVMTFSSGRGEAIVIAGAASPLPHPVLATERDEAVETLTRARYRLPQTKAEALATFLKEHADSEVEARLAGETLIVTASPDAQARIGQFIKLLLPKVVPARPPASGDAAFPVRTRAKTTSQVPALAVKVVRADKLEPGDDAEFIIEVTNTGAIDATDLRIVDHGGSGIEFTSATAGYSWAGDALSWRVDKLAPGKTIRFTVRCKLLRQQGDASHHVSVTSSDGASVKATAIIESRGDEPPVSPDRRLFDPPVAEPKSPEAAAPDAGTPKTP